MAWCPQGTYTGQYECYPCTGTPAVDYDDGVYTVTGLTYLQKSTGAALSLGSSIIVTGTVTPLYVTVKSNYGLLKTTSGTYGATFFSSATDPSKDPALPNTYTQVLGFSGTAAQVSTVLNDIQHTPIQYFTPPATTAVVNAIDTILITISDNANQYAHIEIRIRIGTAADPSKP